MITKNSLSQGWIAKFKQTITYKSIDNGLLEKMIHALYLLEQLQQHQLNFIFKGGTSLILLLDIPKRFSIDIDIITEHSQSELEKAFDELIKNSNFSKYELNERRSYNDGVPKAHYEFFFNSHFNQNSNRILLDILFEKNLYAQCIETPIQTNWLEVLEPIIYVKTPSKEAILGDKLTAFAPTTTGILFESGKNTEIIKQLFDIGNLFDSIEKIEIVKDTYIPMVNKELQYRNLDISINEVIDDTIQTGLILAKKTKNKGSDKKAFEKLERGIKSFRNYTIGSNFTIDAAIEAAGKAAYVLAKIKKNDTSSLKQYDKTINNQDYLFKSDSSYNYLNKLKKIRNGALFYWFHALKILNSVLL